MSLADDIAIRMADELQKSPALREWERRRRNVFYNAANAAMPWWCMINGMGAAIHANTAGHEAAVAWERQNPRPPC